MEMENGRSDQQSSSDFSRSSPVDAGGEARGMDQEVVSLVEKSSTAAAGPERIDIGGMTDEELGSIVRCAAALPYREDASRILDRIARGYLAAFRLEPGLLLLELTTRGDDKEINVYWLEGKNMFRQLMGMKKLLKELADAFGAVRLTATVFDERWAKKLIKSGGKMESYNVAMEI
jgi:hypothetical protein